jgi:hypothetical protein
VRVDAAPELNEAALARIDVERVRDRGGGNAFHG